MKRNSFEARVAENLSGKGFPGGGNAVLVRRTNQDEYVSVYGLSVMYGMPVIHPLLVQFKNENRMKLIDIARELFDIEKSKCNGVLITVGGNFKKLYSAKQLTLK